MPYIIETTGPRHVPFDDGDFIDGTTTTRTAVATLDEAREAVKRDACRNHGWEPQDVRYHLTCEDIAALPATGGTIGPLPDGTVIEVRHVDWIAMRALAGRLPVRTHSKPDVLAAFNAA